MAVVAGGLTFQNSYHSNADRGLSVAMATADALARRGFGRQSKNLGGGGVCKRMAATP